MRRSVRRSLFAGLAVLAVLAGGYTAYWWVAADKIEAGFHRWVADRRANGMTVRHGPVEVHGFPHRLRLVVDRPSIADQQGRWSGPRIDASAAPWDLSEIEVRFPGRHEIAAIGAPPMEATAERALAVVFPDHRGRVRKARINVRGLAIGVPAQNVQMSIDHVAGQGQFAGGENRGFEFSIALTDVVLPETVIAPLGRKIDLLDLSLVWKGNIAEGNPKTVLASWRDEGGTIELTQLEVLWGGLYLSADGTLALDSELQPLAALTARIRGYRHGIDALVKIGAVRSRDAFAVRLVLGALATTTPGGSDQITVPVSVQDRVVSVGPARLIKLRRLNWR